MGNGTSDAAMITFIYGDAVGHQADWAPETVTAAIRTGKLKPCTPELAAQAEW